MDIDALQKYGMRYSTTEGSVEDGREADAFRKYGQCYSHSATKSVMSALTNTTMVYLYDDLYPGKKMTLLFTNSGNKAGFLPRQAAESIPLSSDHLPDIFNHFAIETMSKASGSYHKRNTRRM